MNRSASFTTLCAVALGLSAAGTASPGVLEFEDKAEWLDAIGPFVTVDFTGFEPGTVITDQYADLGVLFTDGFYTVVCCSKNTYPEDGAGLDGNGDITVLFDTPMAYGSKTQASSKRARTRVIRHRGKTVDSRDWPIRRVRWADANGSMATVGGDRCRPDVSPTAAGD